MSHWKATGSLCSFLPSIGSRTSSAGGPRSLFKHCPYVFSFLGPSLEAIPLPEKPPLERGASFRFIDEKCRLGLGQFPFRTFWQRTAQVFVLTRLPHDRTSFRWLTVNERIHHFHFVMLFSGERLIFLRGRAPVLRFAKCARPCQLRGGGRSWLTLRASAGACRGGPSALQAPAGLV
jgi:hypothetical protein